MISAAQCLFVICVSLSGTKPPSVFMTHGQTGVDRVGHLLNNTGQFYSGWLYTFWDDESIRRATYIEMGQRAGLDVSWTPAGGLSDLRFYKANRRVGKHMGWWSECCLRYLTEYRNGLKAGRDWAWYEDGTPSKQQHYKDGREYGRQQAWTLAGKLYANYTVVDGRRFGLFGSRPCSSIMESGSGP